MKLRSSRKLIAIIVVSFVGLAMVLNGLESTPDEIGASCPMPEKSIGSFVLVEGGGFVKGTDSAYPEEGPPKVVYVSPFLIQVNEVTNDQFAAFVRETGYKTEAERSQGSAKFIDTDTPWLTSSWWELDQNATWRSPEGAGSSLVGRGRHPVVHVTLNDARAYAQWVGGRVPSEVEWEYAASLGLFDPQNPESGIRGPDGHPRANIWNGVFPLINTEEDGYSGTAPAGCYEANLIGVHDMIGNVWEWTNSPFDRATPQITIKGGSFLCGSNYCRRYRATARESLERNFSTAHVGFRVVKDIANGKMTSHD